MSTHAPQRMPDGAWPVMLTPFHDDRSIDWAGVDDYTDWLIAHRAAGIFTVSLSSEMYHLTADERVALARRVVERSHGRVPVIASAIAGPDVAEQVTEVRRMSATGVDAVVLISSLVATPSESDDLLRERLLQIVAQTQGIALGVYECPIPYKRLLAVDTVAALAQTGSVVFYKDTSHSVADMTAKIAATAGTNLAHYNAEISSLAATVRAGGAGFSGYAANIYPELVAWLCQNAHLADDPQVIETQRLLTIAEHAINSAYPTTAKFFLAHRSDLGMRAVSRSEPRSVGAHDGEPLIELAKYIDGLDLEGLVQA